MAGGRLWGALFFLFLTFASFTTVLAAVQEGYTATGIEVTDTYAELARERIRKELACAA